MTPYKAHYESHKRPHQRTTPQPPRTASAATSSWPAPPINAAPSSPDKIGEYHFDCPLDNILFGFKGVTGDDFKAQVQSGASDEELVKWLDSHGVPKTPQEIKEWSDGMEAMNPYYDPERRDWYSEQTEPLASIRRKPRYSLGSKQTTRRLRQVAPSHRQFLNRRPSDFGSMGVCVFESSLLSQKITKGATSKRSVKSV